MSIEEFMSVFKQIVNEFTILNEHFDSETKSKTTDYDVVFFRWTKDMSKRYKGIPLSMHWATSAPLITKNQILFNVRFKDEYFCEIKYIFNPGFVENFRSSMMNFLDVLFKLVKSFQKSNDAYDYKVKTKTSDYDVYFSNWKKEMYVVHTDIALDSHWGKKTELIEQNPVFLNIMFKDDCLFEIKYRFIDENEIHTIENDEEIMNEPIV